MAILIEHYNGAFPLWLAHEQIRILPISDKFVGYAKEVSQTLSSEGLRVHIDDANERVNAKIKVAQDDKVPYMLVVGGRDAEAGTVSVRDRSRGDLGPMQLSEFTRAVQVELSTRGQSVVEVT